jgi:hypothetical protein
MAAARIIYMAMEFVGNIILSLENCLDINTMLPNILSSFPEFVAFTLGIALYGIIIYNFYRFTAKRDIFHLGFIERHKKKNTEEKHHIVINFFLNILKYGFAFPVIVFFWFAGFSVLLFFLAKSVSIELILLISITVVSAVRITSYYREDLSRDLAKTLPLTLLAIALMDPNFFSFSMVWDRVAAIDLFVPKMITYVIFTILMEWLLRVLLFLKRKTFGKKQMYIEQSQEK